MKTQASLRALAMAAATCAIVPTSVLAAEDQGFAEVIPVIVSPAIPAAAAPAPSQPSALVMAIQQASTPSIAIQAYADAKAANPNDLGAEQAYVRRMAELGLPEMADSQARELNKRMPDNGVAWAVSAYVSAKRDQVNDAVTQASTAARLLPNDPFVQRTAGQIVAWYDSTADRLSSPPATRAAVDALRTSLQTKQGFSSAYMEAANVYRASNPATTQPTAPQQANVVVPPATPDYGAAAYQPTTVYEPAPVYVGGYYGGYGSGYYGGDPYWWPGGWGAGFGWWWPSFGSVVIVNRSCNFHHGDFDDSHHHGFNGSFGAGHAAFASHNGFHGGMGGFTGRGSAGFVTGGFTEHMPAGFVASGSGRTTFGPQRGTSGGPVMMQSPSTFRGSGIGPVAIPAGAHMSPAASPGFGGRGFSGGPGFHDGGGMHGGFGASGSAPVGGMGGGHR